MDNKTIGDLRVDYALKQFDEKNVLADPFDQFEIWFREAMEAKVNEPNAMTLATVKPDGTPAARIVLLKGMSSEGFSFFTNYNSDKGDQIGHNNAVAVVFCWLELQRQVRIEGHAFKATGEESDAYFLSRPRGSQIGAHASPQSRIVTGRNVLEENYTTAENRFKDEILTRPEYWGGYIIKPQTFEFWQGRQNRLHDRFRFNKIEGGKWSINRLAP